jgi:hypothetical protein
MHYLYIVTTFSDVWDEIPHDKREWWLLEKRSADRQELVDLAAGRKSPYYKHKLVYAEYSLSDFFFPRAEIKRRTNASKMLKAVGYTNETKTTG